MTDIRPALREETQPVARARTLLIMSVPDCGVALIRRSAGRSQNGLFEGRSLNAMPRTSPRPCAKKGVAPLSAGRPGVREHTRPEIRPSLCPLETNASRRPWCSDQQRRGQCPLLANTKPDGSIASNWGCVALLCMQSREPDPGDMTPLGRSGFAAYPVTSTSRMRRANRAGER